MEMEEAETIDVYELDYSDLCSPSSSTIVDFIMEALGPSEPGLPSITSVPNASNLCSHLLPLARNLALLDRETRKLVPKVIAPLLTILACSGWSSHSNILQFAIAIFGTVVSGQVKSVLAGELTAIHMSANCKNHYCKMQLTVDLTAHCSAIIATADCYDLTGHCMPKLLLQISKIVMT
ncbi:hypothetical protein E2542_SST24181 [Spatholobus suberectus]|nr:hypothetical protein E2542_SST24181 [Spatholobus suberectus]